MSDDIRPMVRLDLYSHHIKVTGYDVQVQRTVLEFCRTMAEFGQVRKGNRFVRELLRTYAARNADFSEVRLHINQFDDFKRHLTAWGVPEDRILIVKHPLYTPVSVDFPLIDNRPPRTEQLPIIDYLVKPVDFEGAPSKVVTLQTGKGKMQPLDAKIRIPGGWTTMGELAIGDTITSPYGDGNMVAGIYPHGQKQMFRVTFADGRSTECGAEHLWRVFHIDTSTGRRWRTVDTIEMMRLLVMPNPRVYVQLIEPEDNPPVDLPVEPYLLGLLLGDGSMTHGLSFTSADEELVDAVRRYLPEGATLKHVQRYDYSIGYASTLVRALEELGLKGCGSATKFIPEQYLEGSITQKRAILQGLLDTDGTVQKSSSISYCTISRKMAEQVQYLVRSLGGIATLRPRQTSYTWQDEKKLGQPAFEVDIRYKKPSELFRLSRKRVRTKDDGQYCEELKLRVMSVEPTTMKQAQCISVTHPSQLYVTDDFIVTHNTFLSLYALRKIGKRVVLVIKGGFLEKWISDVQEAYGFDSPPFTQTKDGTKTYKVVPGGELMGIKGASDLEKLIKMASDGTLTAKFIIITGKTLFNYYKAYETFGVTETYPVAPEDFYQHLGVGVRLIDEVHMEFHANYRQDLYTHVPLTLSLSATLDSDNSMTNRMFRLVWPKHSRAPEAEYHRYISCMAVWYNIAELRNVRTVGPMRQYSHIHFEQSIMRSPRMLKAYSDMILDLVEKAFVQHRQPGQKMLVFCARTELCTLLRDMMRKRWPTLLINRYVQEDSFDKILEADITVSTILSAGTAIDIPNLRTVLMTTMINSKQSNIQVLGRLRVLKDYPDVMPQFLFLAARNIEKHREYTKAKQEKLKGKVLHFNELESPYIV